MNPQNIKSLLSGCKEDHVNKYIAYLDKLQSEKKKDGEQWVIKNPWFKHKTDEYLATIFKSVQLDGLFFDGDDITLQNTGVSYSYQAFKNKMLNAYPESVIDVNLVNDGDSFDFSKESGHVKYKHKISNPFGNNDKSIIGAYCVIKNKRGEFLTLLSRADIEKHRRAAKTDSIWRQWFSEMAMKTIIKKACKQHFKDIYHNIETIDNENYDLDNLVDQEEETKREEEEFLAEMKWFAVHEPVAYKNILNTKWQLKSAREITKPSARGGVLRELREEAKKPLAKQAPKEIKLEDSKEWKEWLKTKEELKDIVGGWQDPANIEQCIQAVEQAKKLSNK